MPILRVSTARAAVFSRRDHQPRRWFLLGLMLLVSGLPAGFFSLAAAPGFVPLWKFTPEEKWQAEWLDKANPAPFTVTSEEKGTTVAFSDTAAEAVCPLRALQWREITPLGIKPTRLSLDARIVAGTGLSVAPQVLDVNGNLYQLTTKPVTGQTLVWDLSTDLKSKLIKANTETVPAGTVLAGPVYLDQLRVVKPAGAPASVVFTGSQVIDPAQGTMALAEEPLFAFTPDQPWLDVNVFDESLYKVSQGPDGLTVTYGPTPKKSVFKFGSFTPDTAAEGAMGRIERITTDIELVEGAAGVAKCNLGLKDSEHEVLTCKAMELVPGHNKLVWDSSEVDSPWRGGHNGMTDFPLMLDDYTLTINGSTTETKLIFHSATKQVLRKLVYESSYGAGRPRWIWNPGETANIKVHLANMGTAPYARPFNVALLTDQERPVWNRVVQASVPAKSRADLALDVDTKGLPHGVYILRWSSTETADGIGGQALLTVADTTPLPKAKPGEFLFGIDAGAAYYQPNILDWADWCGIDVVRGGARSAWFREGVAGRDFADGDAALDALEKRGMKGSLLMSAGVPWDKDPAKFDAIVAKEAEIAGLKAAHFKGRFLWYEYGNEPSLQPFFFHGPPADYVRLYIAVHDAIKAAYPEAIVTNGGWAFAGAAGAEQRVREMAKLLPAYKVDAWAYHGHGDGAKAERHWYELARSVANYPDKVNKPYYETESGATSTDPVSWRAQARTLVQKFAYAQSLHTMPAFIWFGFHPKWEWGILQTFDEAKPAALAYRVFVQRTRGLRAQDRLDIANAPGEGYWFVGPSGQTTVVLWSDTGEYTRVLSLGAGVTDVQRYDMFGNVTPLAANPDGTVQVQAGLDPIYICAKRPAQALALKVLPPALELPEYVKVIPGMGTTLTAKVRNHGGEALQGTLEVVASGGAPVAPANAPVKVAPGGASTLDVPIKALDVSTSWWPRGWVVFAPVVGEVDLSKFTSIPTTLSSDGKALAAQFGTPQNNHLDLAPLGGGQRERKQAICFARVDVPADMDVEFGAAADYWMEWWLNGKPVLSTMSAGNGQVYDIMTHVVKAHFNKGPNLLAVRVLSGSGGWELVSGGPESLATARQTLSGTPNGMLVELKDANGATIDREAVKVDVLRPLVIRDASPWSSMAPDALLGTVNNFFKAAPDATHWYHGKADLSGQFWYRAQPDGSLLIEGAVTDDIDQKGDGIHIEVASGAGWKKRVQLSSGQPGVTKRRDEAAKVTWYEAVLSRETLGVQAKQPVAIQVNVDDDDWGVLKQTSSTAFGSDPNTWDQTWFAK